jgi:hypothetical protein
MNVGPRIVIEVAVAVAAAGWAILSGCGPRVDTTAGKQPNAADAERAPPVPPIAKKMPHDVLRKLSSPTPAVAAPISEAELVTRARAAALEEGYPVARATETTVSVQGAFWQVNFVLYKLPPGHLGGEGVFVLMDYQTGAFAYAHWDQ